tara:strand:- start:1796 stop:2863 length:1068 start_codon:yes stop_codon:yes gene_type:complete
MGLTEASAFKDGKIINDDINASAAITNNKLADSGVTAGTSGSSTAIPVVTVNSKGIVTAISTTAVDATKIENGTAKVEVASDGPITSTGNHDFTGGIDVTGNITTTGNLTLSSTSPSILLTEGDANPDYIIKSQGGIFKVRDQTNGVDRISVNTDGHVDVAGNLDVGAGVDITGNLSVTGTTTLPDQGRGLVPVGTVITFAGSTPPDGYLKANGDTIPNGTGTVQQTTADFSALYAIVGATLPDLRGEFVRGWADNRNVDAGRSIRSSQSDLIESHRHWISRAGIDDGNLSGTDGSPSQEYGLFADAGSNNKNDDNSYPLGRFTRLDPQTQDNGNGDLHAETRPRNVALLMCIKY